MKNMLIEQHSPTHLEADRTNRRRFW